MPPAGPAGAIALDVSTPTLAAEVCMFAFPAPVGTVALDGNTLVVTERNLVNDQLEVRSLCGGH